MKTLRFSCSWDHDSAWNELPEFRSRSDGKLPSDFHSGRMITSPTSNHFGWAPLLSIFGGAWTVAVIAWVACLLLEGQEIKILFPGSYLLSLLPSLFFTLLSQSHFILQSHLKSPHKPSTFIPFILQSSTLEHDIHSTLHYSY